MYLQQIGSTRTLFLDDAVRRAVDECISEGILTEFLAKNRAEVIRMSIFEYDKEVEERKLREAFLIGRLFAVLPWCHFISLFKCSHKMFRGFISHQFTDCRNA